MLEQALRLVHIGDMAGADPTFTYLDKRIEPNRSLSERGMRWVLLFVALGNLIVAAFLFSVGAYPAPVFLGIDMVAIMIAFKVMEKNRRRRAERVRVQADAIEVLRPAAGSEAVWRSAPVFTRVELDPSDPDAPRLSLASAGRRLEIGSALGGEARRALALEIETALGRARVGRHDVHDAP
jgi:uncharacterized membrane protein